MKSRIQLSDFTFTFHFHALEKEMVNHSSVLAWRLPGTGEPGGLPSVGSHRVRHDWSNLAAAAAVLCIRWPKYWSFSFSISPSNEYSGPLDLLAVQGTLKSLLQHRSSKASVLWCSAFFIIQISHPYMTTRKPKALTRWTFVGNVSAF